MFNDMGKAVVIKRIVSAQLLVVTILSRAATLVALVLIAWWIDSAISGVSFGDWLQVRWYLPTSIVALLIYGFASFDRGVSSAEQELFNLGKRYECAIHGELNSGIGVTGSVEIHEQMLGPYIIEANSNGAAILKGTQDPVFYSWSELANPYRVHTKDGGVGLRVDLRVDSRGRSVVVVLPWSAELDTFLPN